MKKVLTRPLRVSDGETRIRYLLDEKMLGRVKKDSVLQGQLENLGAEVEHFSAAGGVTSLREVDHAVRAVGGVEDYNSHSTNLHLIVFVVRMDNGEALDQVLRHSDALNSVPPRMALLGELVCGGADPGDENCSR